MAKKKRKKSRRPRLRMTDAEARQSNYNDPCPRCESQSTYVEGYNYGQVQGCHDCKHVWGWADARGSRLSRAKFKERAASAAVTARSKSAESWRLDAPREETEMAKTKKKSKKAAKGGKTKTKKAPAAKKTDGKRDSRIPKVGTVLKAKYKGKEFTAKVLADGFEFKGETFTSISKVGSIIMAGKACNGYKLFGLC